MAKLKNWQRKLRRIRSNEREIEERAEWLDQDPGFTPEFIAQRQRDSRRMVNTAMQFWRFCPQRTCRRHHRCAHDPDFCGPAFWPLVPEPLKAAWRALHDAKADGRTCRRAFREADAAQAFEAAEAGVVQGGAASALSVSEIGAAHALHPFPSAGRVAERKRQPSEAGWGAACCKRDPTRPLAIARVHPPPLGEG